MYPFHYWDLSWYNQTSIETAPKIHRSINYVNLNYVNQIWSLAKHNNIFYIFLLEIINIEKNWEQ